MGVAVGAGVTVGPGVVVGPGVGVVVGVGVGAGSSLVLVTVTTVEPSSASSAGRPAACE